MLLCISSFLRNWRWLLLTFSVVLISGALLGCSATSTRIADASSFDQSDWAQSSGLFDPETKQPVRSASWTNFLLPGKKETRYLPAIVDGRGALQVHAESAASMLRLKVHVPPADLGLARFSWKVTDLIAAADMGDRHLDDAPVRVVLAFDGDRGRFSVKNAMLSELTHALTGEPMPYAVMMYVWSKHRPVGTVIPSPRTDRIRKLVVETGPARLGQWLAFERDISRDFEQIFGEAPGTLIGMGVMTDTDNTQSIVHAAYGPLTVQLRPTNGFALDKRR